MEVSYANVTQYPLNPTKTMVTFIYWLWVFFNTLRPRQNGRRVADDTFKRIFLNENVRISIKISLKFVPKGSVNNNPALVQIMAWRRSGDKPLSEPMMVSLLTHICITRRQWVKISVPGRLLFTINSWIGLKEYRNMIYVIYVSVSYNSSP